MANKLVLCGDHKMAPSCIVCVHLANGTATSWGRIPAEPGEQDDWICADCGKLYPNIPVESLMCVCIHCVRKMQEGK